MSNELDLRWGESKQTARRAACLHSGYFQRDQK